MLFATFWQLSSERSAATVPAWTTQGYDFRARPQRRPVSLFLAWIDVDFRISGPPKDGLFNFERTSKSQAQEQALSAEHSLPSKNWICSTVQEFTTAFCYYQLFKHVSEIISTTSPRWFIFHSKYKKKKVELSWIFPSFKVAAAKYTIFSSLNLTINIYKLIATFAFS